MRNPRGAAREAIAAQNKFPHLAAPIDDAAAPRRHIFVHGCRGIYTSPPPPECLAIADPPLYSVHCCRFEIARNCLPPHPSHKVVTAQLRAARRRSPLLDRPGFLIRRLHQLHCALFLKETRRFGITPVQYSLLTTLSERDEMDQNGVALEIGLERTSVAEVIPRLQARGLLNRRRSAEDGRVKLVKLTRKGKVLIRKMAPAVRRAHARTIDQLDPTERSRFLLQLIKLVESNNQIAVVPLRLR